MSLLMEAKYLKKIYVQSQNADPSPPLGTVLGNLGVNTVNFCNSFNVYTNKLPVYFLLKVYISIYDNRTCSFNVRLPSTCFFLKLLRFERTIKVKVLDRYNDKVINCVRLRDVLQLARLKFPFLDLKLSVLIIRGSVRSMDLIVVPN